MTTNTSTPKLASAGDDIKIWDSLSFSAVHHFTPCPSTLFRSLHWSPDCHQLVLVPTHEDKVFLTLTKKSSLHSIEVMTGVKNSCAKFSNLSPRYLGIGTITGNILMWDLKTQKPKKTFMGHSEVNCLQFNHKDSYIAAGCVNGDITLNSLKTGQSFPPLRIPKIQSITDLQYNNFRPSLLGSASDDGGIYLWDTNAHNLIHQYAASHDAPATGLAFSPINNRFLVSVGLDKKIICYDTKVKRCMKVFCCEEPFSAVDFMEDGITLAAGSTRGKIYICDLRSSMIPLKIIEAHSVSVQSLAFQKLQTRSSGKVEIQKKVPSSEPSSNNDLWESRKIQKLLSENDRSAIYDTSESDKICSSDNKGNLAQTPDTTGKLVSQPGKDSLSEAFSPLKDHTSDESSFSIRKQPIGGGAAEATKTFMESEELVSTAVLNMNDKQDINTKLDEGCITTLSPNFHEQMQLNSYGRKGFSSQSPPHGNLPSSPGDKKLKPIVSVPYDDDYLGSANDYSPSTKISTSHNNGAASNWLGESLKTNVSSIEKNEAFLVDQIQELATHNCSDLYKNLAAKIETQCENSSKEQVPLPFQVEFVRQIVQDAMEEFTDKLRNDLLNLHVQMIRQFQNQMIEIRALVEKCSLNEDLAAEIEKLQEENRQLRTTF